MIQASSNSARLVAEDRVRMTGAVTTRGGTAAGGQHRVFIELRAGDCCPTQRGVDTGHWTLDTAPHWPPQHCRDWPQLQNNVASYLIFIRLQHLDGFASRTQPTAHNLTLFQIMIVITMRLVQCCHHTKE